MNTTSTRAHVSTPTGEWRSLRRIRLGDVASAWSIDEIAPANPLREFSLRMPVFEAFGQVGKCSISAGCFGQVAPPSLANSGCVHALWPALSSITPTVAAGFAAAVLSARARSGPHESRDAPAPGPAARSSAAPKAPTTAGPRRVRRCRRPTGPVGARPSVAPTRCA